jgi:RND superfamily putative drug exporter
VSRAHTGRLVTSAALILAVSLISLRTNPDLPVRVIATGLSLEILLDAIVIHTLLVPALVALFGRWNWWMPDRLGRLLRIADPHAGRDTGMTIDPSRARTRSRVLHAPGGQPRRGRGVGGRERECCQGG